MKYWLLTTEYPPQYGGGIGTYCSQWSAILKQNGIELTIFILDNQQNKFKETIHDNICLVKFSPYLKNTSDFLGYETMVSASFEEITSLYIEKEGPPDWLEAQEYQGIAYFILQKKHLGESLYGNLKILITCHCPSFITFEHNHVSTYQLPYFWIGEMEKFCMKAADLCIFPSKYLADEILKRFPNLIENYSILHNPYLLPDDLPNDKSDEQNDFVVVGKLSPAKGALAALEIFEQLWKSGYPYKLKLIGDESYFHHALGASTGDLIKKHYTSYLHSGLLTITGPMTPTDIRNQIHKTKIILVPSTIENLPYTVIESMAAGKVVLASAQGGQKEIIHDGHNGFLFDYTDPSSFEEKIHIAYRLRTEEINKIAAEAMSTIKNECDPQTYFTKKMEILNYQLTTNKNYFPFISSFGNNKIHNSNTETNQLLSVVIPYFNMGKYITETIASVDASAYRNKEIIIVNDGSTDGESIRALQSFKSRKDIKIVEQEKNLGLASARNFGAQQATGEYLAFLDADDTVATNYFEKAINILKTKQNVHFVGCWVQYFDNANLKWPAFTPEPPFLLYHNMVNSSSLVYKKEGFLRAGLNDAKFIYGMEDYDSVINLVKNGYLGVVLPEFLFFYRVRKDSMARGFNKSNRLYLYRLLAEKHKDFYTTFATELFDLLNANGPGIFVDNPSLDYHLREKIPFAKGWSGKLIYLVKRNRFTRKMAYKIYRLLNK